MSSSGSSARWVCSRTSRRSASSAVRRISSGLHAERRARGQRDPHHGPPCGVVVRGDQPLAVGEHLVVVLHHRVRRQPAVLGRDRHRAAGRVEPQPHLARRHDLGRPQVAAATRAPRTGGRCWWCSRRGPAPPGPPRRTGTPPPRPGPAHSGYRPDSHSNRVPLTVGAYDLVRFWYMWWWVLTRPGVTRQPQASRVSARPAGGLARGAHPADQPAGDGDPAAGQFPLVRVAGGDQLGPGDHQVGAGRGHHWCSGSPPAHAARAPPPRSARRAGPRRRTPRRGCPGRTGSGRPGSGACSAATSRTSQTSGRAASTASPIA